MVNLENVEAVGLKLGGSGSSEGTNHRRGPDRISEMCGWCDREQVGGRSCVLECGEPAVPRSWAGRTGEPEKQCQQHGRALTKGPGSSSKLAHGGREEPCLQRGSHPLFGIYNVATREAQLLACETQQAQGTCTAMASLAEGLGAGHEDSVEVDRGRF